MSSAFSTYRKIFQILLTETEIRIKIKDVLGKTIKTNIGSPQGDSASAILFILYLALRNIKLMSIRMIYPWKSRTQMI